jgi:hypothetical protein
VPSGRLVGSSRTSRPALTLAFSVMTPLYRHQPLGARQLESCATLSWAVPHAGGAAGRRQPFFRTSGTTEWVWVSNCQFSR